MVPPELWICDDGFRFDWLFVAHQPGWLLYIIILVRVRPMLCCITIDRLIAELHDTSASLSSACLLLSIVHGINWLVALPAAALIINWHYLCRYIWLMIRTLCSALHVMSRLMLHLVDGRGDINHAACVLDWLVQLLSRLPASQCRFMPRVIDWYLCIMHYYCSIVAIQ